MSVCSLCLFLFSSPLSFSLTLSLSFGHAPPLFMWQRNSCLVQGIRLARQAGCGLCRARTLSSLSHTHTHTHTHIHTHTGHTATSIHIHLKAREEGVGSWTHISWVSIEAHQRELWCLGLEKLNVTVTLLQQLPRKHSSTLFFDNLHNTLRCQSL